MARKKTTSTTSSKSVKKKTVSSVASKKAPKKSAESGKKTLKSTSSRSSKSVAKTTSRKGTASSTLKKKATQKKTPLKGAALKASAKKSSSSSVATRKKVSKTPTKKLPSVKSTTAKSKVSSRGASNSKAAAALKTKKATIKTKVTKTAPTKKTGTKKSALASASKNKSSAVSRPAKASVKASSKTENKRAAKNKTELKNSGAKKSENTIHLDSSKILAGKKTRSVVNTASSLKKEDSSTSKRNMSKNTPSAAENSSSIVIENSVNGNGAAPLNAQINVTTEQEVPVKRKRGRPRKSESTNGASAKLKETKGVRRFGMNYGRPGVAAGRYSWSAETGSSLIESTDDEEKASLLDEVEISSSEMEVEFNQGDKVVYPAHGLGIVEAVQVRTVGGSHQKFYMISIVETGMKIMVPVGQSKTVGLRRVVDPTTVDQVYDILRDKDIVIDNQTWNRRYREYSQKIKTGSVLEIASVIRDLTVLKIEKELSFNERRMLDTAQGLLVKELSIAKASSEDSIKEELELICQP